MLRSIDDYVHAVNQGISADNLGWPQDARFKFWASAYESARVLLRVSSLAQVYATPAAAGAAAILVEEFEIIEKHLKWQDGIPNRPPLEVRIAELDQFTKGLGRLNRLLAAEARGLLGGE